MTLNNKMKTLCLFLLLHASLQLQCDKKKITAHIGEEFVLVCKYDSSRYLVSKKYWCRGSSRNSCQILMDTDGIAKSAKSQIFDNNRNGLFVKVTNLQIEDSDVYWIGIDKIYSDIMVSVNLVVTKVPVSKPRLWPLSSLVPTCWGEPVTVRCGCTKGDDIYYTWYQQTPHRDFLVHRSSDLSLHCGATKEDSKYYCFANNSVSSEQSDIVSVHVLIPANSSCIYVVNIQGQPAYDCADRMRTTTAETPPLTTCEGRTETHSDPGDQFLTTNQTDHVGFFSRAWTGVPLWYTLLRWGLFASLFITLCIVLRCTKARHKKYAKRRRRRRVNGKQSTR
ncbi:uncharacterized protein LOC112450591 [Kryptolebias marmoratus]|uniref:uncharacterized protein LOC112450591 n=1 Tax=Kryptolebias marmoratus TaxID=37003 RepID=UPI000D530121|nr:uncharacterized protein LOC112450591 [Kryptolebias marmoratus]